MTVSLLGEGMRAVTTRAWLESAPTHVPAALAIAVGGHPLVAQTLARHGITTPAAARAFLDPAAYTPAPPDALPGLTAAADRLEAAIHAREPICVWGDFDVDGQTATTLLVSTLTDLGGSVTYHIPVRAAEGHGVSVPILAQVIDAGARLILTCDTGIAAVEAAAYARSRGVDLIITDHHDLPPVLPAAYAIINPKLGDHSSNVKRQTSVGDPPSSLVTRHSSLVSLPGVGVAYKLAEELYRRAGRPEAADGLLDLVALGIVADLAAVRDDTRYLLQRGLDVLRETRRLGLQLLMESAGLSTDRLGEEHISFVIAPRMNALGRLADANVAVEFLTTVDLARARLIAADLEALNSKRKLLCDQVYAAAEAQLQRDPALLEAAALVLAGPGWHPGVVGIVASRLVERYGVPTVLLSLPSSSTNDPARGSARSVAGVNISAAIAAHADLLLGFGGHPMAAGLSLAPDRIPEFRRALSRTVEAMSREAEVTPGLQIDGELPLSDLTLDFAADVERLAPFGPGNPPLTLVSRDLTVRGRRTIGRDGSHLLVVVEDAWGTAQEVIWWDGAGQPLPGSGPLPEGKFDLAYTVRSNDYRGVRGIQVTWVDARPAARAEVEVKVEAELEVVDYRGATNPGALLDDLLARADVVVWCEGDRCTHYALRNTQSRTGLAPSPRLAIWTAPPGPAELRAALARVKPQTVYLFGVDPGYGSPSAFLNRLAGLVKHALSARAGGARISELAAATAAREATVRAGLTWLAARGSIGLTFGEGDEVRVSPGDGAVRPDLAQATSRLEALLTETAAYRAYFASGG